MRTWRQGVIGKIKFDDREAYLQCLKYPLAVFYSNYEIENGQLDNRLFFAFLKLETLVYIEKIDTVKMLKDEKDIGRYFEIDYTIGVIKILDPKMFMLATGYSVRKIKVVELLGIDKIKKMIVK